MEKLIRISIKIILTLLALMLIPVFFSGLFNLPKTGALVSFMCILAIWRYKPNKKRIYIFVKGIRF